MAEARLALPKVTRAGMPTGGIGAGSIRPAELQMDPRSLPGATYQLQQHQQQPRTKTPTLPQQQQQHHMQVDVSTQVDLHDTSSLQRGTTPLYSREDIKEQYCITSRQLDAVDKSGSGIFGCLTSRGPSPCSASAKASILSACVRSAPSEENLFDAPYPYPYHKRVPAPSTLSARAMMMPPVVYQPPYSTYPRQVAFTRYHYPLSSYPGYDEDDWLDSSYIPRRLKSSLATFSDSKSTDTSVGVEFNMRSHSNLPRLISF
ncbi:uncharacterized protein LOC106637632 [Copidosoma floridanum]|uniref:uncharacterized protein LOC106637632 n=1 Tax=Copidosoma floridanum TaxID=29053 RepID=UPI000C6F98CE|nr:uncharacterized protein LOC106637632 [Copidosoma floridanum]